MIRETTLTDIPQMQVIRNSVKENVLSDPDLVQYKDYEEYLDRRGKGWVYEDDGIVTGFAIVDLQEHNVWALFLLPEYEGRGMGRLLHDAMLQWYFAQTSHTIWLSTSPGTRAEAFYRKAGWEETGIYGKCEIKFEMSAEKWRSISLLT